MQFSIAKSGICHALSLVSGVVAKHTTIPVLSNVKLQADADGLTITGTDLELSLSVRTEAVVDIPGVITLPAKRLQDFTRLLPDGDVRFKTDERAWATITAGRSRTRMAGMDAGSFPELPAVPAPIADIDAQLFARQLARVQFAISKEESRFTLNGALVELSGEGLRCVATDGHRLAWTETKLVTGGATATFIIPKPAMVALAKVADVSEGGARFEVSMDENHLFFTVGPRQMISRKLVGNFPDYHRILPKNEHHVTVSRDEMRKALERVKQFADERSKSVKFTYGDGEIRLVAATVEAGDAEETVSCEGSAAVEMGYRAQYIMEALGAVEHERAALFVSDSKSAGEVRPMAGAGTEQDPYRVATDYRVITMPMRI